MLYALDGLIYGFLILYSSTSLVKMYKWRHFFLTSRCLRAPDLSLGHVQTSLLHTPGNIMGSDPFLYYKWLEPKTSCISNGFLTAKLTLMDCLMDMIIFYNWQMRHCLHLNNVQATLWSPHGNQNLPWDCNAWLDLIMDYSCTNNQPCPRKLSIKGLKILTLNHMMIQSNSK